MTQEEIKDIIIKNIGSDQYGFLYREIETAELIYSLHLKSMIDMLKQLASDWDSKLSPRRQSDYNEAVEDGIYECIRRIEVEIQLIKDELTKIEKE